MAQKLTQGLLSEHFSHPLDRRGMQWLLDRIPSLDRISNTGNLKSQLNEWQIEVEDEFYLWNLADNTKLSEMQGGSVYRLVQEVSEILGVLTPHVFLDTSAEINAYVLGEENPTLVLTSALLDAFPDNVLKAVIGHELGHIICQHTFCRLLAENYNSFSKIVGWVPFLGPLLSLGMQIPLFDWYRKSELSADRAALLATQNLENVQKCILLLAGGATRISSELSLPEFSKQAKEFEDKYKSQCDGSITKQVRFLLSDFMLQHAMRTHPWPAVRLQEINKWKSSKQYELLVNGEYEKAAKEKPPTIDLPAPTGEDLKDRVKALFGKILESGKDLMKSLEEKAKQKESNEPEEISSSLNEESESIFCDNCGAEVSDRDNFCSSCGVELSESVGYFCSDCGATISSEDKICPHCKKEFGK